MSKDEMIMAMSDGHVERPHNLYLLEDMMEEYGACNLKSLTKEQVERYYERAKEEGII